MSNLSGFPSVQKQLSTAVRKAIFTSAAVTTAAIFTPATFAEAKPTSTATVEQLVQASNNKAAKEPVVDLTKVAQDASDECNGDNCEQSATGESDIRITNSQDLERGDASVELGGSVYNASEIVDRHDELGNDNQAADKLVGIGQAWTNEDPLTTDNEDEFRYPEKDELAVTFDEALTPDMDNVVDKLKQLLVDNGFDGELVAFDGGEFTEENIRRIFNTTGGDFSINIAEEGSAVVTDASGIRADAEDGNIVINNTGDITVGSGERKEYWTDVRTHTIYSSIGRVEQNGKYYTISLTGDWIDEGTGKRLDATAYAAGIKATSLGGNITISNSGNVSSLASDGVTVGEVATAIEAETHTGNIDISNIGNVLIGAGSAGITAKTGQDTGDIVISGEGEIGDVLTNDFSETLTTSYTNGTSHYSVAREYTTVTPAYYQLDDNGVFVTDGDGEKIIERQKVTTTYKYYYDQINLKNIDGTDSTIEISNGEAGVDTGNITIRGNESFGILAQNPSGDSVSVTNHGSISFESGDDETMTAGVGIFVDTTAYNKDINSQLQIDAADCAGELTAQGTCVVGSGDYLGATVLIDKEEMKLYSEMEVIRNFEATNYFGDGGDVTITNTGDIDISAISPSVNGTNTAAIYAASYGSITIDNSGDLSVGTWGSGIFTKRPGETEINNHDNQISLSGSGAVGIKVQALTVPLPTEDMSLSQLEMMGGGLTDFIQDNYSTFENGDTVVNNSGDIISVDAGHTYTLDSEGRIEGTLNDQGNFVPEGVAWQQIGMSISAVNANKRGTDMSWNTYGQDAIDHFNENGSELDDVTENVEFYDIDVVNSGDIVMGKAGVGIQVAGVYGEAFLTHTTAEGADSPATISVDDSLVLMTADESAFFVRQSTGVSMRPAGQSWTNNHFTNEANIDVGLAGVGVSVYSGFGSSYAVNNGDITVDDGVILVRNKGEEDEATARVLSVGLKSAVDGGFNGYAKATNNSTITTGDDSVGMMVINASTGWTSAIVPEIITTYADLTEESAALADRDHMRESAVYTATAVNGEDGVISTGDNSVGMVLLGKYNYGLNQGKIYLGAGGDAEQYSQLQLIDILEQEEEIANGAVVADEDLIQFENRGIGIHSHDSRSNISVLLNSNEISSVQRDENGDVIVDANGDDLFHANNIGIYAQSIGFAIAGNEGGITLGDNSVGLRARAASAGQAINRGEIVVGDNSIGVQGQAIASGTAINSAIITTGDNGIGVLAEGTYASAYNVFELTSSVASHSDLAVGVKADGLRALAANFYSFSTIDMGENSTGIHIDARSLAQDVDLVNARTTTSYIMEVINDEAGEGIIITEEEFPDWKEQNEDYVLRPVIVADLDEETGEEITRPQEEYVLDDNGDPILNEETGHYLTQNVLDEDGNVVMLVKQKQDTNEDGELLYYLAKNAQAISVSQGSISQGTALNAGIITATDGIVIEGINTEAQIETVDLFEVVDGSVQNVEFHHGEFGSVLTAQNTGAIYADNIGIDVNNATNTQVINAGLIEADTGIEIEISAVKEHVRSQLAYKPAVDEDGNPIVQPWYDYSKPILDENGELVRDDNGQVQYETYTGTLSGDTIYLQGTQAETSYAVDANGNYVYDTNGNHVLQQNIEEIEVDAAIHTAVVNNSGIINAERGIVITADQNGATFASGQTGQVVINNSGFINAEESIEITAVSGDVTTTINNSGYIGGNVTTTDGDDIFYNGLNSAGTAAGQIALSDTVFDFKGGNNQMVNRFGDITFEGHNEIRLGTHSESYFATKEVVTNVNGEQVTKVVVDTDNELTRTVNGAFTNQSTTASYVTISSLNGSGDDTLVVHGDMNLLTTGTNSGLINIETNGTGSDQIIIEGDLTAALGDGNANVALDHRGEISRLENINMTIAPQGQLKGKQSLILVSTDESDNAAITVKGEANYDEVVVQAISGNYADTVIKAEVVDNDAGQQVIELVYGLSDLGVAASSVSHMAANYWSESVGAFQARRSSLQDGFSGFVSSFHTDSDVELNGEIEEQDLGFAQRISGLQAGLSYKAGNLAVTAFVGEGNGDASMAEPSQSESSMTFRSFGLSVGYQFDALYLDAVLQSTDIEAKINSFNSSAETAGTANGLSLEAGYAIVLDSEFNIVPQIQVSAVEVELDEFSDSTALYDYGFDNELNVQTRLGVNVNRHFEQEHGFIQPYATFSLVNTQAENTITSQDVPFLSDMTGTGYVLDAGVNSRYKQWTIDGQLGIYDGEANKDGLSIQLSVGYKW